MRRELTVYVRDPTDITEGRLSELVASCGVSLHEVRPLDELYGYTPHRIVAYGQGDELSSFSEALLASRMRR